MNQDTIVFLNKCKIPFDTVEQLEGMLIPREIMLSNEIYNIVRHDLSAIKKSYSSSGMKSLQQNAYKKDRWPLLNLVRQLLKACNFRMRPVRISDGYAQDGKKKYKRYFRIESFKKTEDAATEALTTNNDQKN